MLKNVLKILPVFFFSCLIFLGIDRLVHPKSNAFSASHLLSTYPPSPEWALPDLDPLDQQELDQVLNQHFTFFNKGTQAYVFISEDKKYVIKFLKQKRFRPRTWLSYIPLSWNPYYQDFLISQNKRKEDFTAYKTAYTQLKNETGVLYVHLNKSNYFKKKLPVFYRNREIHLIDLDQTNFIVQKKASLIYSRITELMSNGEIEQAKQIITSIFTLIHALGKKGVVDNDAVIHKNFGLIEDIAVQIDIGKLKINLLSAATQGYKRSIPSTTQYLKTWIEKNYPELRSHFAELMTQSEEIRDN